MMNQTKEHLEPEHLRHFTLAEDPFFELGGHGEIWINSRLDRIKHLIEMTAKHQGMMVLTGDYGAGKSSLLRHCLREMITEGHTQVIMPDRLDRGAMRADMLTLAIIENLAGESSIPSAAGKRDRLAKQLLVKAISRGERPLLVIDEAHDLRSTIIIALKRLWDSGMIFRNIGILLVGAGGKDAEGRPWGLRLEIEGNPDLREFAERSRLVDLGKVAPDLPEYLAWRFHQVAADVNAVFEPEAVELLAKRSQTPQLMNILATKAMKEAYLNGALKVSASQVKEVI